MDLKLVPGYLKSYGAVPAEDKDHEINYNCNINFPKIQHHSEQLFVFAKAATHAHVRLEDMEMLLQLGDALKKELDHVRSELARRKNLELLLPSPNTQHHLPCSSLLSPTSPTPPSPTAQQSMAMSTNASTSSPGSAIVPQSPTGSSSPHSMMDGASMSIPSTGVMQSDEYWRSRKMDPTKIVRRSPTPLYVNLTEQMILAQSSKQRKRPAEGDLYCHNCKTKDTPEWRRGPMGAKTLCNACGIRWRLSQAEAGKQKKDGAQLSPTSQTPQLQFPMSSMGLPSPHSPQNSPTQSPTQVPTQIQVSQSLLQQQQQHIRQQQQQLLQQHQLQQQLQQQYNQSHAHHNAPHPQQQHMVVPGPVGLAQENIPNGRLTLSSDSTTVRSTGASGVLSALSLAPSPIAT